MWLQRMPSRAQMLLTISEMEMTKLTVIAEKVQELADNLNKSVEELKTLCFKLSNRCRFKSREKGKTDFKRGFYYYHRLFGEKANRCSIFTNFLVLYSRKTITVLDRDDGR